MYAPPTFDCYFLGYFNLIGQVIVVLGSDWSVVCLNAKLKHLWTRKITEKTYKITGSVSKGLKMHNYKWSVVFREASVLVLPAETDKTQGTIFVGGRIDYGSTTSEDSFTR